MIKELITEIEEEDKKVEQEAFRLFCKDIVRKQLKHLMQEQEILDNMQKRMDNLTIEKLKEEFNQKDMILRNTHKEIYMEKVKNGSNNCSN